MQHKFAFAMLAGALPIVVVIAATGTADEPAPAAAQDRDRDDAPPRDRKEIKLLAHTTAIEYQRRFRDDDLRAWRTRVPQVQAIRVPSSVDDERQYALWYDPGSSRPRPLLVVLHSWSADYEQNLDIPFAEFAIENGWAFIHPDFRGPNLRPQATASALAVQDVVDAVKFARERAAIDESRIYLVGYSGGGMKALVLAGRHPDLWAGVAAWGAIYDIADWYRHNGGKAKQDRHYRKAIAASCGGVPRPGTAAQDECEERSPLSHLAQAAGRVPVLIAHGLQDRTVPLAHALRAYEALAAPEDRFTDEQKASLADHGEIPEELQQPATSLAASFDSAGTPLRLERRSRTATLVLYEGGHDMLYNAALLWLNEQRRPETSTAAKRPSGDGRLPR